MKRDYSVDAAEISVLGSMILNNETIPDVQALGLAPEDFSGRHAPIFTAIQALSERRAAVDFVTLSGALGTAHVPYLSTLVDQVPAASNAVHYAKIVRSAAQRRRLRSAVADALARLDAEKSSPEAFARELVADLYAFTVGRTSGDLRTLHEVGRAWCERMQAGPVAAVSTGLVDLDELLGGGLRPQELFLLAARPGAGKTTLALNIAETTARAGKRVACFSLEMGEQELFGKLASARSRVDLHRMHLGRISKPERQALADAAGGLIGLPLLVDESGGITVAEIAAKCRREQAKSGLDLVVIDYLQLIAPKHRKNGTRNDEIGEISRGLKLLAKDLRVPILALSQLNRLGDTEEPRLSSLRESGSLEQDADNVLFLVPASVPPGMPPSPMTKAILAKHRLGPSGTITLTFLRDVQRFECASFETPPAGAAHYAT